MKQAELLYNYNLATRPRFNSDLFTRKDDDLINAIKNIIYSCERDSVFTIKVLNFEVIENYDDVNHILWAYEDSIINKTKLKEDAVQQPTPSSTKKKSSSSKKDNPYEFINLKDSDVKIIKITYFVQIVEKKNGLVNDTLVVYIAIPRIVDKYYYRINGNMYSAMYQIVDASTYNNSAAVNVKKQSVTFKTVFMPIRAYRYTGNLKNFDGEQLPCTYFLGFMFKKSLLLMKYIFAKFGLSKALQFLKIQDLFVLQCVDNVDIETNYIFPVRDMYVVIPKAIYNNIQVAQSAVYTIISVINHVKDASYNDIFSTTIWLKSLGAEFTSKDPDTIYSKGLSILGSLEFIYDLETKNDLKLSEEDKGDIYRVIRWIMYEFTALRAKDNLDISTKKVRYAEYIASLYAARLANGIYRLSDKGDKADLSDIRKAIQIPPMYLLNAISKCQLVSYKDCVNDLDSITAIKYTYKGISGIGEKSNAIPSSYRSIHPSHLGRVDVDSSSNSDPGISGTICPLTELHDGHFTEYEEPSSWESKINKVMDEYKAMISKKEMCKIISDNKLSSKQKDNTIINECISINRDLLSLPLKVNNECEFINGYDIFGDGIMFVTWE